MSFYEALSTAMEIKGVSPAELCARTGMHQSYLSKLKSGHTKDVTWEKALVIIDALGMTPSEFVELQERKGD